MGRNINTSSNEYKNLIKENKDLKEIIEKRDNEFKETFLRCLNTDTEFTRLIECKLIEGLDEVYEWKKED